MIWQWNTNFTSKKEKALSYLQLDQNIHCKIESKFELFIQTINKPCSWHAPGHWPPLVSAMLMCIIVKLALDHGCPGNIYIVYLHHTHTWTRQPTIGVHLISHNHKLRMITCSIRSKFYCLLKPLLMILMTAMVLLRPSERPHLFGVQ